MNQDSDAPTVIYRAANSGEAAAVVTALEAAGIETFTTGGFTSSFMVEALGGVEVIVRQSQADKARQILANLES